jgi:hypothetical protein
VQLAGHAALVPSQTAPLPHAVPNGFGENTHAPIPSQPVHVWHAAAEQALAQQFPLAPAPASTPQVKPEAHSAQEATMHVAAFPPASVLQLTPFARRATHVPAPLQ